MSATCDALALFGATGDLAKKMLYPALYELAARDALPDLVVGVAVSEIDVDGLRDYARQSISDHGPADLDDDTVTRVLNSLTYCQGDYREDDTYTRLGHTLGDHDHPLIYLAIPPSLFTTVIAGLVDADLNTSGRLVIEKPFGHDLASAQALNRCVLDAFDEDRVHRIDHFLGKEQVLDLLVFRLANSMLDPAWNSHYIDSVQITMAEDFGVTDRGAFYDETGALRDVVQNHLLQVLAQIAMEPPVATDARSLREEKVKVLRAVATVTPEDLVRGQFEGYRQVEGVAADSDVETFVALKLHIESWRWAGVPFYIRAGKRMAVTATDVLVEFKRPAHLLFAQADAPPPHPNHLLFRLKPGERVSLSMQMKKSGEELVSEPVELTYDYTEDRDGPDEAAYARLLGDALEGDQHLFARADGVEEAWRILEAVLADPPPVQPYAPGSWGPPAADTLIEGDGGWHCPDVVPDHGEGA
ncbi:MAG: glucose-6-phosphate dehydrogenase [Euzebya sp.]